MYKANWGFILFIGMLIIFFLLCYNLYFKKTENEILESSYSYRGIKLIPENAPSLSNLFQDRKDSHNEFISSSECLKCHSIGMKIKGKVEAPQIVHNVLEYCVSCHTLAENGK